VRAAQLEAQRDAVAEAAREAAQAAEGRAEKLLLQSVEHAAAEMKAARPSEP